MGNSNDEGEARWEASKGAVGSCNNEGEMSKWAVGNSHRQVKLLWATATTRWMQAKAL